MLLLLTACASPGPDGFYGTPPLSSKPAPSFTATNSDGADRVRDDLLARPTVVWFYPAAATSG